MPVTRVFKATLKKKHLDKGKPCLSKACPFVFAIVEAIPGSSNVGVSGKMFGFELDRHSYFAETPTGVADRIKLIDAGKSSEIEVPYDFEIQAFYYG